MVKKTEATESVQTPGPNAGNGSPLHKGMPFLRPAEWKVSGDAGAIDATCFVGTPGDAKVKARYSGRMYAMELDWVDDVTRPGVITYWYTGGPGDLAVSFGSGSGRKSTKNAKAKAKAKEIRGS